MKCRLERKWGDNVCGYLLQQETCSHFGEKDGLHSHLQTSVSDTPAPTHHPHALSHIGCLGVKGHLCINESTLLFLDLEQLPSYPSKRSLALCRFSERYEAILELCDR